MSKDIFEMDNNDKDRLNEIEESTDIGTECSSNTGPAPDVANGYVAGRVIGKCIRHVFNTI